MSLSQVYVAITLEDGKTAVMGFLTRAQGVTLPHGARWSDEESGWWLREPTQENIFAEVARVFPNATAFKQIDPNELPADRTYRDALAFDGRKFTHDMTVARDIHRDHLRHARAPLFEQNDLAIRDAQISGDRVKLTKAAARRDYLRNITADPRIDAAQSTDELKQVVIE